MNNRICIIKSDCKEYPRQESLFRPSTKYEEYPFEEISADENVVYDMVRRGLRDLGLDSENYGIAEWNPLKDYVFPGDRVIIKPNMVMHINKSGGGTDCLYTNPSVVAAIVDYVIIALKGTGEIVVGDAPLQECDFEMLIAESGYDRLLNYYHQKGISIDIVDFRNVKTYLKDGLHYLQEAEENNGVTVKLNKDSCFYNLNDEELSRLRITNYDPRVLSTHHIGETHEYRISSRLLEADVVINLPKPKTHRKSGVTIALKNMIGINANKEYLPHHMLGSAEEGGDSYRNRNDVLDFANRVLDMRNMFNKDGELELASYANEFYKKLIKYGRKRTNEKYWEGSWYGNKTIWRTIVDLNRIMLYADKTGIVRDTIQRRYFIVADMIVSGEKEGPLEPTPIYPGIIAMGDDPLLFDRIICTLMGFDYSKIPLLQCAESNYGRLTISTNREPTVISNNPDWDHADYCQLLSCSMTFRPTDGWMEAIGKKYICECEEKLNKLDGKLYIFGCGSKGIRVADRLGQIKVSFQGFCDNDASKWGQEIEERWMVYSPESIDSNSYFILAVGEKHRCAVRTQIENMKCKTLDFFGD